MTCNKSKKKGICVSCVSMVSQKRDCNKGTLQTNWKREEIFPVFARRSWWTSVQAVEFFGISYIIYVYMLNKETTWRFVKCNSSRALSRPASKGLIKMQGHDPELLRTQKSRVPLDGDNKCCSPQRPAARIFIPNAPDARCKALFYSRCVSAQWAPRILAAHFSQQA